MAHDNLTVPALNHKSRLLKMTEKRKWRTIVVKVKRDMGEDTAACLARITGSGVMTEDDGDCCLISAYIEEGGDSGQIMTEVRAWAQNAGATLTKEDILEEKDWLSEWKKDFTPLRTGNRLVIAPSWEKLAPEAGETVITIDPGTAFGTGHHESTAMALELIEALYDGSRHPVRVLDVGCGTGILAIACARLGAKYVIAIDCDPEAVRMTEENARINGVAGTIQATTEPVDAAGNGFELICANIIHNTLVEMADAIAKNSRPGGALVLAGILRGWQEENIERIYRNAGFLVAERKHRNEWTALLMNREGT